MIIIGIGNRFRQDDAVGLVVARRLRAVDEDLPVIEHEGDPLDLLSIWSGHDLVMLIDALNAPAEAGTIYRFDLQEDVIPPLDSVVSSHGHSLWDAYTLAGLLGQQPERVLVYAIGGSCFGQGEGLSPLVEHAVDEVVDGILATMSQYDIAGVTD